MDTERMNIEEELNQMINEMNMRTGQQVSRIMCSQDTLNQLWEQTRMIYINSDDIENNTGYVARYNGIPVTLSPDIEQGKFLLLPEQQRVRPLQVRLDSESTYDESASYGDFMWPAAPRWTTSTGWNMSITSDGSVLWNTPVAGADYVVDSAEKAVKRERRVKEAVEEQVEIDEGSFLDILKGNG